MSKRAGFSGKKVPKISISSLVQKGSDLFVACSRDRAELEPKGLAWGDVLEMHELSNVAFRMQAEYQVLETECRLKAQQLRDITAEYTRYRNTTAGELRRAYRIFSGCTKFPAFAKKPARAQLAQDLFDLHWVIDRCRTSLEKAGFDMALGRGARERSDRLLSLIAQISVSRNGRDIFKATRDEKLSRLYKMIKDICSVGRRVFEGDPRARNYYCGRKQF